MKYYQCKHCKQIVTKELDANVKLFCCGEVMEELVPNTHDGAGEKHVPVYDMEGNTVHVTVGSVEHPMTKEHYIEWICLETEHGIQYVHLDSNDKPKAKFSICDGDEIRAVYAFCNQHDLWRK